METSVLTERRLSLKSLRFFLAVAIAIGIFLNLTAGCSRAPAPNTSVVPEDIKAVFDLPLYQKALWGLRVVDVSSGNVLIDSQPGHNFLVGSVRKIFSIGELLNQIGPDHTFDTPVYRLGDLDRAGVLHGNLIVVASGDLTMGGRTNPDGSIAISEYDHNEADSLGNAILTAPDPLAGYHALARQIAAAGIKEIDGNVIIDDRLFTPFNFRGQFDIRPIFVNDDVVDLTINPTAIGAPAAVVWRPVSVALRVANTQAMSGPGSKNTLELNPELPQCIGVAGCTTSIDGSLPMDFVPPLTGKFPLVQTVRIVQPSNYARTVLIEALHTAGVKVDASPVAQNPVDLLPPRNSYPGSAKIAELTGMPYSADAKFILKVSYNIGADTSLLLYGLTQGVNDMDGALAAERRNLTAHYGIPGDQFKFVDGSGGGSSTATTFAVTKMLLDMVAKPAFTSFFAALPILGVDGSLGFVKNFQSDPALAGATAQVSAKTGTYVEGSPAGIVLRAQALAGYIKAKSGRQLAFALVVNEVPIADREQLLRNVIQVFQDQGTVAAILWRDY
jgi:PBP4 family serine-type D-alanyl-D-alanine carboxypeptidase